MTEDELEQKIISHTTYWAEFLNNNPNPEPIQAFTAEDPILTKIFNIAAIPNIFYEFDTYPFDEKLSEFSTISRDDRDHLYDAEFRSTDGSKESEWLGYMVALYELVGATLRFYDYHKRNSGLSGRKLLEYTFSEFNEHISVDEEIIYETGDSEKKVGLRIGRMLPGTMVEFLVVSGKVPKFIAQLLFRFNPSKELIRYITNHFDFKSVINYKRYRSLAVGVCYGGFDPDLDKSSHNQQEDVNYLVEFFYEGKKIDLKFLHQGKKTDHFDYSIRKRFKPLLMKDIWKAEDPIEKEEQLRYAEKNLLECIENFNEKKGLPPAFLFTKSLEHIRENIYEKESTENIPKELGKDLKRIRKTELEHSGERDDRRGSWRDDSIEDEDKKERKIEKQGKPSDKFKEAEFRDVARKIRELICEDEIDEKILDLWWNGTGTFEDNDEKINYSAIAKELGTYDNDIRRRWKRIQNGARKHPAFKDFLE
jgi:hypothetical protein